jgi:DNA-directed RNA polymerase I, II, and III subunit RPABC2
MDTIIAGDGPSSQHLNYDITKYERARAIGTRARQISENSPVYIDATGMVDELDIATAEYHQGKSPLIIRRYYPDHTTAQPHFVDISLRKVFSGQR